MGLRDRRNKNPEKREVNNLEERLSFLIVCEGEKTEPNYFRTFERVNIKIKIIPAAGNTLSVVDIAIDKRQGSDYDQVWCVFDRDSFPGDHFDNAIKRARANNIEVAYTNEAFELWYILHYAFHITPSNRNDYSAILTKHMGKKYHKNDPNMRSFLGNKVKDAIRNAKSLRKEYAVHVPNRDNPYTTVDKLVELLLKNSPK